jgi:glutamate transport system permease protein
MNTSFLYDELGPRGRSRARVVTMVSLAGLAVLVGLAVLRLGSRDQLDPARWAILFDPATGVPQTLGRALVATLEAALLGMVIALVVGLLLAAGRLSRHRAWRVLCGTLVEGLRGVPLLLLILFAALGLPRLGIELSLFAVLVLALVAYNSAVLCEIIRAGVLAIDEGQREAAAAMGLRPGVVLRKILLPQAIPQMLPVIVSQLVILLKDTSLGFIIGYAELLRSGRSLVEYYGNRYSLQIYLAVAVLYIATNFLISHIAHRLARRPDRRTRTRTTRNGDLSSDQQRGEHRPSQPTGGR